MTPEQMVRLGAVFRRLRHEKQELIVDVERGLGGMLTRTSISRIEEGKSEPQIGTAWLLARYYRVSLDQILRQALNEGGAYSAVEGQLLPKIALSSLKEGGVPEVWPVEAFANTFTTAGRFSPRAFAFVVEGDAMQSARGISIPARATVVAEPVTGEVVPGGLVIAMTPQGILFRQLTKDGDMRFLSPLNDNYPVTLLNGDCRLIARAMTAHIE